MARYRGKPAQWRPFWTLNCWQACTNVLFKKVAGFGLVCWVPQRCCSVAWFVLQLSSWGTAGGQPSQLLTLSLELPCLDFIADRKFMYFLQCASTTIIKSNFKTCKHAWNLSQVTKADSKVSRGHLKVALGLRNYLLMLYPPLPL